MSVAGGWFATYREAKRAEARFEEVRKLAKEVLFDFNAKIQHLPGSTPARELLVRTALQYLNNLSTDAAGDKSLQWELVRHTSRWAMSRAIPPALTWDNFGRP